MKKLLTGYWPEYLLTKIEPFDNNLEPTMSNLANSSFGNEFGENVVFFVVDNTSSSHTDNQKNNFYYVKD